MGYIYTLQDIDFRTKDVGGFPRHYAQGCKGVLQQKISPRKFFEHPNLNTPHILSQTKFKERAERGGAELAPPPGVQGGLQVGWKSGLGTRHRFLHASNAKLPRTPA